ncbi:MAG: RDD family protein [Elusimicrobiota bacterium]
MEAEITQRPGWFRRAFAFLIDFILTIKGSLLLWGLTGLIVPMDGLAGAVLMIPAILLGFAYLIWAPRLAGNWLGKFAMRLRVVNEADGKPPTGLKYFLRGLPIGLWPVEAIVLLFSHRRLGDRLAGTVVVFDPENRVRRAYRLGAAALALVTAHQLSMGAMGLGAKRSDLYRSAVAHIETEGIGRTEYGSPVRLGALPRAVTMLDDTGRVVVSAAGPDDSGFVQVDMRRVGGRWTPSGHSLLKDGGSRNFSFTRRLASRSFTRRWASRKRRTPFRQAAAAYKSEQHERALELALPAAEDGDAESQNLVGMLYEHGKGVEQDQRQAMSWFRKAAAQGQPHAQRNLGLMHAMGKGVPQDAGKAAEWYRKAAEGGHVNAQLDLGVMYTEGRGVPKDYSQALKWFRIAARHGNDSSQANLGAMYAEGWGVPKDPVEAYKWLHLAASQGLPRAKRNLEILGQDMTPEQIAEAKKRALRFSESPAK